MTAYMMSANKEDSGILSVIYQINQTDSDVAVALGVEVDVQVPGLRLPLALVREATLQLGFSPGILEVKTGDT